MTPATDEERDRQQPQRRRSWRTPAGTQVVTPIAATVSASVSGTSAGVLDEHLATYLDETEARGCAVPAP